MTWLKYAVDSNNSLVEIADVPSGKSKLFCPYCAGQLIARKGKLKQHHFAHAEETCYPVATKKELPTLPLYDNFHIKLSGTTLQLLQKLWQSFGVYDWGIPNLPELKPLIKAKVLQKNVYLQPPAYEFTSLGKIPIGALPLHEFNQVQEPLLLAKLAELSRQAELAKVIKSLNLAERLVDLRLYRAQLASILLHNLYYLQIEADGLILHKIGVTKRSITQRIPEIERDLRCHYQNIKVSLLGLWSHRGNVELYFKHRYKSFNYRIGSLTEYYLFSDISIADAVLDDLNQMQPKVFNPEEKNILAEANIYRQQQTETVLLGVN
ncbi:GIY-YIG nuclease family protein [Phormidium sp. LEGE 05292]|uniref:competence protein CoiA family protein n=1 Tax=[Phormidium] sp. LEGE 05292 TaxID=767427 RepID=UPI00187F2E5D|nr:competence protein CoiA family protein [Phormidium sp. LEGE 05292]MBE9229939.1 GIY-YIG nuclease family protein [Phormidium sp. LEGE 05292]